LAKIGDLFVQIGADVQDFEKGLKKVEQTVGKLGKDLKQAGGDLTKVFTAPIAGFAIVALKSSKEATAAFSAFGTRITAIMGELGTEIFRALNLDSFLSGLGDALRSTADWFKGLSDGMKTTVVTIAAVVAGLGPALFLFGQTIVLVKDLAAVVRVLTVAMNFLALNPIILVLAGVAALAVAFGVYSITTRDADKATGNFSESSRRLAEGTLSVEKVMESFDSEVKRLKDRLAELTKREQEMVAQHERGVAGGMGFNAVLISIRNSIAQLIAELAGLDRVAVENEATTNALFGAYKAYGDAIVIVAKDEQLQADALDIVNDKIKVNLDLKKKLLQILPVESEQLKNVVADLKKLNAEKERIKDEVKDRDDLAKSYERFGDAMTSVAVAEELALPHYSSINAELQARIQRYDELRHTQGATNEQLEEQRTRIEELSSPLNQLVAHIQEVEITSAEFVIGLFDQVSQGIGNALAQIIVFGGKVKDVFAQLGKQILATVISTLVAIGIQQLILAIVGVAAAETQGGAQIGVNIARAGTAAYAASIESQGLLGLVTGLAAAGAAIAAATGIAAAGGTAGIGSAKGIGVASLATAAAAEGGLFTRPALTTIGERGPEIVLNRRNVEDFMSPGMGGLRRVEMFFDGRPIAEYTLERMPEILRLHGVAT